MNQEISNYNQKISTNNSQITSLRNQITELNERLAKLNALKLKLMSKYGFMQLFRTAFGQRLYKNKVSKNVNNEHKASMSGGNYQSILSELDAEIANEKAKIANMNATILDLSSANRNYSNTIDQLREDATK